MTAPADSASGDRTHPFTAPAPKTPRDLAAGVVRIGAPTHFGQDFYHRMMACTWRTLFVGIGIAYAVVNGLFATLYWVIGDCIENARPGSFEDAYFFSVQTMATIGYGKMIPRGTLGNILVSVEALAGLIGVALATGLLFSKFSRPTARVMFSNAVVIGPRDGVPSLMLRMANERVSRIVEAQLRVVLLRLEHTLEGEAVRRFYDLPLLRSSTTTFALTWTAVHSIDARSPLYGCTEASLRAEGAEIVVSLVGLEETMSQTVHARYTYGADQIVYGARFADVLTVLPDGRRAVDYTRFHDLVTSDVPPVARDTARSSDSA
jgi:inward rectifier potassium channel